MIKKILDMVKEIENLEFDDEKDDSYENIVSYFSNNTPNYLVLEEQEEVTKKTSDNKRKKELIALGSLIILSCVLFTSSFRKTEEKENTKPKISFFQREEDDYVIKKDGTKTNVISGKELYDTFIQYAKDNDVVMNGENYADFANFYIEHLENGGEKYYSLGGKNNER